MHVMRQGLRGFDRPTGRPVGQPVGRSVDRSRRRRRNPRRAYVTKDSAATQCFMQKETAALAIVNSDVINGVFAPSSAISARPPASGARAVVCDRRPSTGEGRPRSPPLHCGALTSNNQPGRVEAIRHTTAL